MTAIHNVMAGSQGDDETLVVTLTPSSIGASGAGAVQTTAAISIGATGGSGSYDYFTSVVYGACTVIAPTTNAPSFSVSLPPGESENATCQCLVTDQANPSVTGFKNIYVTFERT